MAQSAKVLSIQALKDFRVALVTFTEEARNALGGVDMELKRMRDWLERDQLSYWQMQVKRRHEAMMMARTELFRRRDLPAGQRRHLRHRAERSPHGGPAPASHRARRRSRPSRSSSPSFTMPWPNTSPARHPWPIISPGVSTGRWAVSTKMIDSLEAYLALNAPAAPPVEAMGGSGPGMTSARVGGSSAGAGARDARPRLVLTRSKASEAHRPSRGRG